MCDPAGGAFTITLFAASGNTGRKLKIVKTTSNANAVTVDANASETINGIASVFLYAQWDSVTLVCDGSNWVVSDNNITIGFMGHLNGSDQEISSGSYTTVAYAAETWDTASGFDTSTYKFTVPAGGAGYYHLYANSRFKAMTSGANIDWILKKTRSGSTSTLDEDWIYEGYNQTAGNYDVGGGVYLLAAGDLVFVEVYQDSGSGRDLHGGQYITNFRGHCVQLTWA